MSQIFRIALCINTSADYNIVGLKTKVAEPHFWLTLENKVKSLTTKEPHEYERVLQMVKDHLLQGHRKSSRYSLTIADTFFEITGMIDKEQ